MSRSQLSRTPENFPRMKHRAAARLTGPGAAFGPRRPGTNPDGSKPKLCPVCEVDHDWAMADLSHGIIRLIEHANELRPWAEYPISGDNIARQRAGVTGASLLGSMYWEEEDE